MATQDEKQLLIDTLKFTPRTYKISMWRKSYGHNHAGSLGLLYGKSS